MQEGEAMPDTYNSKSTDSSNSFTSENGATELIVNGSFTSNANSWTLNTGWAYNSNNVTYTP